MYLINQRYKKSDEYLEIAQKIIPTATQTFSKGPQTYGYNDAPHYLIKGNGAHVTDVDGNTYIDYSMGMGTVLLGHADARINDSIYKILNDGTSLSLMHPLEIDVASKILKFNKWASMVRFGKNGSDVLTAAVRLARAYTKKRYIAVAIDYGFVGAYHGWHDWSAVLGEKKIGILKEISNFTLTFPYNNADNLEKLVKNNSDIAAIVLETTKFIEPTDDFVSSLNSIREKYNILLIIDEVSNGLKIHPGGSFEKFRINPDLCAYGKGISNGIPFSALVGKKDIMHLLNDIMFTLSYGGELLGLSAVNRLIDIYFGEDVFNYIENIGKNLMNGLHKIINEFSLQDELLVIGYSARFMIIPVKKKTFCIDVDRKKELLKEQFLYGILSPGVNNISYAHTLDDVNETLNAYEKIIKKVYKINT